MFIEITALFSIFYLIIAENSTNLLLADSVNFAGKTSEDDTLKNILDQVELLQTVNENLRVRMTSLGVMFDERLTGERKEIKEALEEFKAALTKENKPSTPVDPQTETANGTNGEITDNHCNSRSVYRSCAEALKYNNGSSGVYIIKVPGSMLPPFYVYCLKTNSSNGTDHSNNTDAWLVFQRRMDGSLSFYKRWVDYQNGFGHLEGEFFMGLDKLYVLTKSKLHELWIQMEDFEGERRWAKYAHFAIGDEGENYALNILGSFSGNAGDSLSLHAGHKFTTKDRDNDIYEGNCAQMYFGAWWYHLCHQSNLNGQYLKGAYEHKFGEGINWATWHGFQYSLKYVHMAIRPLSDIEIPHCP